MIKIFRFSPSLNAKLILINPRLLRMRSEGYCACAARVTVVVLCLCVCLLQRFNRNAGHDVNVKVEVPTQYKSKNLEYKRRVFRKNASFPRNGNVTAHG